MVSLVHHTFALLGVLYATSLGTQASPPQQEYHRLLQEREQLSRNVRVMEQEARLSKDKHLYLVVDFRSKQILLKMSGLLLKRISVFDVRKLGRSDCSTGSVILEKLDSPKTPRVSLPGGTDAPDIIGVADMPPAYKLGFRSSDRSVTFSIRPVPFTLMARTWLFVSDAFQSGSYAVMRAFGFRNESYRLLLLPEHAQALYWAVGRDIPAILVCD